MPTRNLNTNLKVTGSIELEGILYDGNSSAGTNGQVLSSTSTGTDWVTLSEISGVDGTGTANYLSKWLDANTITNSLVYDNGTNVGIGTTNPATKLEVNDAASPILTLRNPSANPANAGMIKFIESTNTDGFQLTFNGSDNKLKFISDISGTEAVRMVIQRADGNVGIGTTNPSAKLHVESTSTSPIRAYNGSHYAAIGANSNAAWIQAGGSPAHGLRLSAGANGAMSIYASRGVAIGEYPTTDPGADNFTVAGNVGIGTNSPASKLHVAGTASIDTLEYNSIVSVFGQRRIKLNELSDVFYQADKRFTVTGGSPSFFNGNFDQAGNLPTNTTNVINVNVAGQQGVPSNGITYPQGAVYISFYYTNHAYTAISLRHKSNGVYYSSTGTDVSTNSGYKVIKFPISSNNYLTDIEISITTDANLVKVSAINYLSDRWNTQLELPYVSKYLTSNTVFGEFGISGTANNSGPHLKLEGTYTTWELENQYTGGANNDMFRIRNTALSSDALVINRGNNRIGVGTTNPENKLHVVGTRIRLDTNAGGFYQYTAGGGFRFALYDDSSKTHLFADGDGSNPHMTFDAGFVGIGIENPSTPLEVAGKGRFSDTDNTANVIEVYRGGSSNSNIKITNSDGYWVVGKASGGFFGISPDNLNTNAGSVFAIKTDGNVGIGTTNPTGKLHVGDGTADDFIKVFYSDNTNLDIHGYGIEFNRSVAYLRPTTNANKTLAVGTNTRNFNNIYFYTSGSTTFHNANDELVRIDSAGNVGIGTTNPNSSLHIRGANTVAGTTMSIDNTFGESPKVLEFTHNGNISITKLIGQGRNNGSIPPYFAIEVNDTVSGGSALTTTTERFRIKSDGNVGIGTTSPTEKLHISSTTTATLAIQSGSNNAEGSKMRLTEGATYNGGFIHYDGSANALKLGVHAPFNSTLSDDTTVITIPRDTGNVGIGTTSPSSLLHLEAAASPALQIKDTTNNVTFKAYAQDSNSHLANTSNHDLFIDTNNTPRITVKAGGNVGIGTTAPSQKLSVAGSIDAITAMGVAGQWDSSQIRLETTNTVDTTGWQGISFDTSTAPKYGWSIGVNRSGSGRGSFRFYEHINSDTGAERFTIEQDGNVGIGISDPALKLHVNGEVRVDANDGIAVRKIRSNYFSSATNLDLVCGSGGSLILGDGTARLTIASDDSATFAGGITANNITSISNGGSASIYINSTRPTLGFTDSNSFTDPNDIYIIRASGGNKIQFQWYDNSAATTTETFSINNAGNATFAGDLTVTGGDITLGGTGRIQGVDTVSVSTDAANKAYVDAQVGGADTLQEVTDNGNTTTNSITMTNSLTIDGQGSSTDVLKLKGSARIQMENASATDSFYISNTGGSGASKLDLGGAVSIIEGGNVGIGTTSPSAKLDVSVTSGAAWMNLINGSETNFRLTTYNNGTSNGSNAYAFKHGLYYSTTENAAVTFYRGGGSTGGFLTFTTNAGNERMRIDPNGNVGIGITDPDQKLDVNGNIRIPNQGKIVFGSAGTATDYLQLHDVVAGNPLLKLVQDNVERFSIEGVTGNVYMQGNVGIGTTSPSEKLDVNGAINSTSLHVNGIDQHSSIRYTLPSQSVSFARTAASNGSDQWFKIYSGGGGTTLIRLNIVSGGDNTQSNDEFLISVAGYGFKHHIQRLPAGRYNGSKLLAIATTNPSAGGTVEIWVKLDGMVSGSATTYIYANAGLESSSNILSSATGTAPTITSNGTQLDIGATQRNEATIMASRGATFGGNVGIGTTNPANKIDVNGVGSFAGGTVAGVIGTQSAGIYLSTTGRGLHANFSGYSRNLINHVTGGIIEIGQSTSLINQIKINAGSSGTNGIVTLLTKGDERMRIAADGNVGVGITNPSQLLHVSSSTTNPTGIGLQNSQRYYSVRSNNFSLVFTDETVGSERMRIDSSGNVGIGTTSPDSRLDVTGGDITVNTSAAGFMNFKYGSVGSETSRGTITTDGIDLRINATADLVFQPTGNVGIGTVTPDKKLQISESNTSTSDTSGLKITNTSVTSNTNAGILFENYDNNGAWIRSIRTGSSNGKLSFGTNSGGGIAESNISERMVIDHNGNVGIGTNSPARNLHIHEGDSTLSYIQITNDTTGTSGSDGVSFGITSDEVAIWTNRENTDTTISTNNTERIRIKNDGDVGIGITNPSKPLHVSFSGDSGARIESTDSHSSLFIDSHSGKGQYIRLSENNVDKYWINSSGGKLYFRPAATGTAANQVIFDSSGNVGIGTTSPANELDVNGVTTSQGFRTNTSNTNYNLITRNSTSTTLYVQAAQSNSTQTIASFRYGSATANAGTETFRIRRDNINVFGANFTVDGSITGNSKNFSIKHPTKEGKRLVHSCLEGPEVGVYFRGRSQSSTIEMPDYWGGLVHLDSMTVELTAIGPNQDLYVEDIADDGEITVGSNTETPLNYFYVVYGERKDIDKLEIEVIDAEYSDESTD